MIGARVSLGVKLALTTVVALSIVSSLVFYVLSERARTSLVASKRQAAELVTDLFAVSAAAPLDFGDDHDLHTVLENLRVNREITYSALWRAEGTSPSATIGDPGLLPLPTPDRLGRSETRVTPDTIEIVRRIDRADHTALGAAVIRFSLASVFTDLATERRGMALGTVAAAALAALLILAVARLQIVGPLARVATAARRLEAGEAGVTVDVVARDEVGELARAFNRMSAAIVDREQSLENAMARLRELFDNMRQAIVVFGRDGRVDEAPSRQATELFGAVLVGRPVQTLLYADVPDGSPLRQALEEWIGVAFEMPLDAWGEVATLAPTSVHRTHDGKSKWLELQFTPVIREGRLERIMLLATDVTDRRLLEEATQSLEQSHARQIGSMRRLVAGGGQVFATFLATAEVRLRRLRERVGDGGVTLPPTTEILEIVHTIRGESRTFELPELAAECQALERALKVVKPGEHAMTPSALGARLDRALAAVDAARSMFVEASPIGSAVLDQMTVRKSDVARLSSLLGSSSSEVRRAVESLTSRPFGECVAGVESAGPRWAKENGKSARIEVTGREVRVPAHAAPVLTAALPHLVRNAIAHGLETPEARAAAGKGADGRIELSAAEDGADLVVRVKDDGAGIDASALAAHASRTGLDGRPAEEVIFAAGLSTALEVGELAGHGVGLSAVRESLRAIGGTVRFVPGAGPGAEFEIRVAARAGGDSR